MEKTLTLEELRKYVSFIDRISLCDYFSTNYENYMCLKEVPKKYDNYFIYGIGLFESEFYVDSSGNISTDRKKGDLVILTCLEIVIVNPDRIVEI